MMRSLSSAVAGLRTHQTRMDVIGNNIANVNTYGFKASRTTFQDVYYQNLSSGSRANGAISGGTNPTQIGYGSAVATIDLLITQSGSNTTDRALDVYISGDGFITAQDAAGNFIYTRLGNLRFDGEGNLVDGMGNFIMGFPMRGEGEDRVPVIPASGEIGGDELQLISCDPDILDRLTGIQISPSGAIVGLVPGKTIFDANDSLADLAAYIDSITLASDTNLTGDIKMVVGHLPPLNSAALASLFTGGAVESIELGDIGIPDTPALEFTIANGKLSTTIGGKVYVGEIKNGKIELSTGSGANKKIAMTIKLDDPDATLAAATGNTPVTVALEATARYKVTATDRGGNVRKFPESEPGVHDPNGNVAPTAAGPLELVEGLIINFSDAATPTDSFSLGKAKPDEGQRLPLGNIVLAKFRNAAGLEGVGDSYFIETFNSGDPVFVKPGLEGTGALAAGRLEMSNVDLSKEFTDMITTQRGFQSNSRIVSVSDEMLQELVNLKR